MVQDDQEKQGDTKCIGKDG